MINGARKMAIVAVLAAALFSVPFWGSRHVTSISPELSADELSVFGPQVIPQKAGSFGLDRIQLERGSDIPGGKALRVNYPTGSSSQNSHRVYGSPSGGAQIYLPLESGGVSALWLTYDVRFEDGFDFVRGGKLPGLYGGTMTSGGRIPDGTNGLSTRLMWRTGGAGEVYAYLPSSVKFGTSLGRGNWTYAPGTWDHVEEYVRLNDIGRQDGRIVAFVNGTRVLDEEELVFRTTTNLQIAGIFFSTFFGGSDPTWATPRDQYVDFADFQVSTTRPPPTASPET